MIMVLVCLPSDALSQHLPPYLGFFYLGRGMSLHSCSSTVQPPLLILDEGCLLTASPPDFEHGVAPLSAPAPTAATPWRAIRKNVQTTAQLHSSHTLVK